MTPEETLRQALLEDKFPKSDEKPIIPIADPLKYNRMTAVSAWMGNLTGQDISPEDIGWQAEKDALAQSFFKMPDAKDVSDETVHDLIRSHIQTSDNATDIALNSALTGRSLTQTLNEVQALAGVSKTRGIRDRYVSAASSLYSDIAAKRNVYSDVINKVSGSLGEMLKKTDTDIGMTDAFNDAAERLMGVPAEDRRLVIEAIAATGNVTAKERSSYLSKIEWQVNRRVETLGAASVSNLSTALESVLDLAAFGSGLADPKDVAGAAPENNKSRELSLLAQQIRTAAYEKLDPIKSNSWIGKQGLALADMAAQSGVALVNPLAGFAVNLAYFNDTMGADAMTQNPGLTVEQADKITAIGAPVNAAIETITALIPFGKVKLPFVQKWLMAETASIGGTLRKFGVRAAVGTTTEIGEEIAQAYVPLKIQELMGAMGQDMPAVDWERNMPKFADIAAEVWAPALMFSIVGAGAASINDINNGRSLASDLDLLIARGIAPETAAKIKEASDLGDYNTVDSLFREEFVSETKALKPDIQAATERLKARFRDQSSIDVLQDATSPEYTANVSRAPSGWQVTTGDGSVIQVSSAEAANQIYSKLRQVGSQEEADTLVGVIDSYYEQGKQAETVFTGESVQASKELGVVGIRRDAGNAVISQRQFGAKALETVREEAEVAGIKSNTRGVFAHINGSNEVFPMRVADGAKEIVRRMNLYKSQAEGQPQVITFLHENFESTWQLGMANGTFSEQETRTAMRALLPAFEGVTALNTEEAQFIDNLRTLASGKGNETMLRETVSEMVIRDVLGRDRQGRATGMKPGSISRAIEASVMGANTQEEVSALKSILAAIKAFTAYLKGVFGTVDAMIKANEEGKIGAEYDTFINKVLGIDEVKQMELQAIDEGMAMLGIDEEVQAVIDAGNMAFSIAGQNAEIPQFMRDSLETAKAMAKEGKDRETIRAITGWFPGKYDDKMRWEVPDQMSVLKGTAKADELVSRVWKSVTQPRQPDAPTAQLQDILRHPALFSAYPEAATIPIVADVNLSSSGAIGPMSGFEGNVIQVNGNLSGDRLKSTLLHEVQHWIQDKEGFAKGSNVFTADMSQVEAEIVSKAISDAQKTKSEPLYQDESLEWILKNDPSLTSSQKQWAVNVVKAGPNAIKELQANTPVGRYRRTAGEIESRDVQARQSFTPEQRKAIAPYSSENIAKEDAIIIYGSASKENMAFSTSRAQPADISIEKNGQKVDAGQTFSISPAQDAEYLDLAKNPEKNRTLLQRMVDAAAKAAGYDSARAFHGTAAKFTQFMREKLGEMTGAHSAKQAFFFTDSEPTALTYARKASTFVEDKQIEKLLRDAAFAERRGNWDEHERLILEAENLEFGDEAKERRQKLENESVRVLNVYLRGNYLRLDAAGNNYVNIDNAPDFDQFNGSLTAALEFARANGFDGVQIDNFDDAIDGTFTPATHWAVFDPNQIKSADPVTRDKSGQVIPLSQRFNQASPDIRFSISPVLEEERITPENKVSSSINGKPAADIFAEVKKRHGVTRSIYEAGYVLPDGTMLDFTGRADVGDFKQGPDLVFRVVNGRDWMKDQRGVDHREIEWQDMPDYQENWERMVGFLRLGAVRVDARSGMISMHSRAKITAAQASVLKSIVVAADGAYIDLEDDARNRSSMQLNGGKWGKVNGLLTRWANGETPEFAGQSFSISPVRNLNELSDQVERQFAENPVGALEVKSKVIRQFAKLADKWSNERWTPQGNKIRPISEKRTVKSLDKEQAMRQAQREVELTYEGMDKLTPNTLMAYSEGVGVLEDDPLVDKMLNDNGRLMSKATAAREGRNIKDQYNDLKWIPPQWYSNGRTIRTVVITRKDGSSESFPSAKVPDEVKAAIKSGEVSVKINKVTIPAVGGIMPDVMANNLKFDTASEMWAALESSIKSHRNAKEGYAKAEAAVKAVEKAAFEQARAEAQAWRNETDAMQKEDWSPKESLVRDLITLEAIVAMFPVEIRGKIGGFVALARKASEAARLKVLQKQLERGQVLLEKHLKEQYGEAVDKLFDKYRPERKAGEKPKGKLDPDAQEIADKAEMVMKLSADQVNAEIAAINVLLDADNISAEEEAKLEAMRELVQLLGDWKNADSARRESAFIALNDVLTEGWAKWKLKKIFERERRQELRDALISDIGKPSLAKFRDKQNEWSKSVFGKPFSMLLSISSFSELLTFEFGSTSKTARMLEDKERAAAYAYEDAIQELSDRIGSLFTDMAGGQLKGEQLRFDLAQNNLTIGTGDNERIISQLRGIQALLMWQQEDGRRHMEGPRDENGAPIEGKWSYDQAWIDELTSKLSPEALEIKKLLEQLYGEEWGPLNAAYRDRNGVNLPRHEKYAPITVTPQQAKAGEMVDPVSGFAINGSILTPGSLRGRNKRAVAEPRFDDAIQIFLGHSRQMEHWKAYYDFATEAQAVLLNRDVMNAVESKGSKQAVTVLKKWIDTFAQGGNRDAQAGLEISNLYSRASGRAARIALFGRVSTIFIQSVQLAAASVKMPLGSYLKRLGMLASGQLDYVDVIKSPFMQRRYKTAPPIVQQAMADVGDVKRPNFFNSTTPRFLGNSLSGADVAFTGGTYAMILDYHRTVTGPALNLKGEELELYAQNEAERDTEAVAQPVRAGTRSIFENTLPTFAKTGFSFASEARQKISLFAWSAYKTKSDPAQAAKVAFLTFIVGGLFTQVIKNLWREAKGDDDEKMWSVERLVKATFAGPLHGVPGVSELTGDSGLFSGFGWSASAVKKITEKAMEDKLDEVTARDIENALSAAGYFNDTAAGASGASHAVFDFAKVLENIFGED